MNVADTYIVGIQRVVNTKSCKTNNGRVKYHLFLLYGWRKWLKERNSHCWVQFRLLIINCKSLNFYNSIALNGGGGIVNPVGPLSKNSTGKGNSIKSSAHFQQKLREPHWVCFMQQRKLHAAAALYAVLSCCLTSRNKTRLPIMICALWKPPHCEEIFSQAANERQFSPEAIMLLIVHIWVSVVFILQPTFCLYLIKMLTQFKHSLENMSD